ncbi:hypothetical protein BKA69DRAFT_1126249 [Paraphysoderma sedebokerense]|nr:hypothetical protein BKA69DRAFT_1126249 [Paraphysoderma sedebokerense]
MSSNDNQFIQYTEEELAELFGPPSPPVVSIPFDPLIPGLHLYSQLFSPETSKSILNEIKSYYPLNQTQNQVMIFGSLPSWLNHHIEHLSSLLLPIVQTCRSDTCDMIFNQTIINYYTPEDGIAHHVDLLRFQDGIAVISLSGTVVMEFIKVGSDEDVELQKRKMHSTKRKIDSNDTISANPKKSKQSSTLASEHHPTSNFSGRTITDPVKVQYSDISSAISNSTTLAPSTDLFSYDSSLIPYRIMNPNSIQLLLQPGDFLFLTGESRWHWKHGIHPGRNVQWWRKSDTNDRSQKWIWNEGYLEHLLPAGSSPLIQNNESARKIACVECEINRSERVSLTLRKLNPANMTLVEECSK